MADRAAPGDGGANRRSAIALWTCRRRKNQLSAEEGNARLITDQKGGWGNHKERPRAGCLHAGTGFVNTGPRAITVHGGSFLKQPINSAHAGGGRSMLAHSQQESDSESECESEQSTAGPTEQRAHEKCHQRGRDRQCKAVTAAVESRGSKRTSGIESN